MMPTCMKSTRSLMLLVAALLAADVGGLVPNSRRTSLYKAAAPEQSQCIDRQCRKTTELFVSISAPVTSYDNVQKGKISGKKKKGFEEFQWLNWVYQQWRSKKAGELSEEVLKQMAPAIPSWGRRRTLHAAERAEELLERIIEENLAGNAHAELTVTLFNTAMDGFAKVGNPEGVQRILRRMERIRSSHERLAYLKSDVFSMSILATSWARSRSPEAATKAAAILNYMEVRKVTPNTITYNAVLHAVAMGNQIDKALRAEDIVKRMKERHANGEDCKPDIYSYQSLIQAWAKTPLPGSPQKAEQVLRFLDGQSEQGNKGLSPNVYCFTTTIHAWAKSFEVNKARSAYQLLQHLRMRHTQKESKSLKPNVVTFTAVLNACAHPMEQSEWEDAFQIAQLTMAELSLGTYDKPNFLSYAAFLSVCSSTLHPGDFRDGVVRSMFLECTKAGQVGRTVLEKLRMAASPELHEELVGRYVGRGETRSLPSEWTASMKGERTPGSAANRVYGQNRQEDSNIPRSSKVRLKAAQKFYGKSGIYSSGRSPYRLESEGISWSKKSGF